MKIFAIDPGRDGGYALIEGRELLDCGSFCLHSDRTDMEILKRYSTKVETFAFEKTDAGPGISRIPKRGGGGSRFDISGSKANWLRGYSNGFLDAWSKANYIETVMPTTAYAWQKMMLDGIPGLNTKQRSLCSARDFFPGVPLVTRNGRQLDGVADAINIAIWAQRTLQSRGVVV